MESIINDYITCELISNPELHPLKNDTPLLESDILDSISVLELVVFLEKQFGVIVASEDLTLENFETVDTICAYLRSKHQLHVENELHESGVGK